MIALIIQMILTITLMILHLTFQQNISKDNIRGNYLQVFVIEDIIL